MPKDIFSNTCNTNDFEAVTKAFSKLINKRSPGLFTFLVLYNHTAILYFGKYIFLGEIRFGFYAQVCLMLFSISVQCAHVLNILYNLSKET